MCLTPPPSAQCLGRTARARDLRQIVDVDPGLGVLPDAELRLVEVQQVDDGLQIDLCARDRDLELRVRARLQVLEDVVHRDRQHPCDARGGRAERTGPQARDVLMHTAGGGDLPPPPLPNRPPFPNPKKISSREK